MGIGNLSAFLALLLVFVANLFVVWPIVLQANAGVKYGIPFVVHARSSFGVKGANVAGLSRGFIASAWFGIQTVVGANCLRSLAVDFGVASGVSSP
jgi:NCS1 family nucleobase:cation symporter-1